MALNHGIYLPAMLTTTNKLDEVVNYIINDVMLAGMLNLSRWHGKIGRSQQYSFPTSTCKQTTLIGIRIYLPSPRSSFAWKYFVSSVCHLARIIWRPAVKTGMIRCQARKRKLHFTPILKVNEENKTERREYSRKIVCIDWMKNFLISFVCTSKVSVLFMNVRNVTLVNWRKELSSYRRR
jgi:hypothetical protein